MKLQQVLAWLSARLIKPEPTPEPEEVQAQECHWCGADEEPCNCAMVYGDSDFLYDQAREANLERE